MFETQNIIVGDSGEKNLIGWKEEEINLLINQPTGYIRKRLDYISLKYNFFSLKLLFYLLLKKISIGCKYTAQFLEVPHECYCSEPHKNSTGTAQFD